MYCFVSCLLVLTPATASFSDLHADGNGAQLDNLNRQNIDLEYVYHEFQYNDRDRDYLTKVFLTDGSSYYSNTFIYSDEVTREREQYNITGYQLLPNGAIVINQTVAPGSDECYKPHSRLWFVCPHTDCDCDCLIATEITVCVSIPSNWHTIGYENNPPGNTNLIAFWINDNTCRGPMDLARNEAAHDRFNINLGGGRHYSQWAPIG